MSQLRDMRADWLLSRTELHNADKIVSLALNKYADNEGYCWPSKTLIRKESALSKRQITRSIQSLRQNGFLSLFKIDKGSRTGNFYQLLFPEDMVMPNEPGRKLPHFRELKPREKAACSSGVRGDRMSPAGGHGGSFTGDTRSRRGGQDVLFTGDRRAPSGVTGCPPELKDPESFDSEGVIDTGAKAEGQQGEKCPGETILTAGTETERVVQSLSGGCAPAPSERGCWKDPSLAEQVLGVFRRVCTALPRVEQLSGRRTRRILRLSERSGGEKSLDWWQSYFRKVSLSPFLTGKNRSGWRATIDWLLNPENVVKVMEGNYDPPVRDRSNAESRMLDYVKEMAAEMKKDLDDDD